jgi:tryptophan-rich sensory protein
MNDTYKWYKSLIKPSWAPPSWLFGPVWTILYILIFVSFGYVFYLFYQKQISFVILLPFILNLVFNFTFTPLQFGLKNNKLAFIDIIFILVTLVWALISIYSQAKWVSFINLPYLFWVSFATILQAIVTYLNWK